MIIEEEVAQFLIPLERLIGDLMWREYALL